MAPTPQEHALAAQELPGTQPIDSGLKDDAIVITGISGTFPQSKNVQELSDILYNKVNPVTSDGLKWNYKHPEAAKFRGVAPDLDRFDAQFFTIFYRLGNHLDPMARKLLEHTYQAIYDSGLCPADLNGKKVAVFIGTSFSDMEIKALMEDQSLSGLGIIGMNKSMFANRISYWLNVKGPSLGVDGISCSSFVALEQAISAMNRGDCEAAIVGGGCLNQNSHNSIFHKRLTGFQPTDGKTKSFSANADGYTLSDAVGVLFLQKKKDALRIYAEVAHVKNLFIPETKVDGEPNLSFCRNPQITAEFIKQFYKEAQVPPQAVEYVEAYGTGVPDADKSELETLAEAYCKDREVPLMIGSVTSNVGQTEATSGITSITKVLLGYSNGELPGNLHCDNPRQDIEALRDGRMRILTDHQRFGRTYTAINGMSVTGMNSHVLLHGHYKPKDLSRYQSAIPHLVTISGRQETAVQRVIDDLKSKVIDPEELALLHNIHSKPISGHLGRGYVILKSDENNNTVCLVEKSEFSDLARRPLWFVYSGMGSQWAGMGAQLMRIPIFAAAIERCHQVLKPKGLDIVDIITRPDKSIFDNILHSFVGIAAVQIGLTDVLNELGLVPNGIIGHSVGELGCAYADGCLTADEMILSAYSRGMASLETPLIRGSMAAVGLGYAEVSKMLPPGIDVACRNSSESSTISGPADIMREFVAQLTADGIFAKEVPCSNIAYHSRYIKDAGVKLLTYLKEVIKNPKRRSERWVSTSVPQDKWDKEEAKLCSAEYHTNNLLSPVLFEETTKMIPSDAILLEVAPHGLLQAILKRSMPDDCLNVPLTKRGHPDNALYLLQALGDLYTKGYVMKVQALYPKVEFPVSTGTPMLSSLIEWVHDEQWFVPIITKKEKKMAAITQLTISVHDDEQNYLWGNVIRGKLCFPYASALTAVWDTLSMSSEMPKREMSVQFSDIRFYSQPLLHDQIPLLLDIGIQKGTGYFEVLNGRSRVVTGHVSEILHKPTIRQPTSETKNATLTAKDVYQLLEDRGYNYDGQFRSIESCDSSLSEAILLWQNNWTTLIDGMLQLNALRQPHDAISLPTHIRKLFIDVKEHAIISNERVMPAYVNDTHNYTMCGGVTIQDILFNNLPPVKDIFENMKLVIPPGLNGDTKMKKETTRKGVTLQSSMLGKLDSLYWMEVPELDASNLTVDVHYASINWLDVKRASGTIPNESNMYGMDFSGVTKKHVLTCGQRVMGIVSGGAVSTQVKAQPELLWPVPANWSLEDAATVPLAYGFAYYCLVLKGCLTPKMTVLVHCGAGALGQAVISILLGNDCRVFTTVSDIHKKRFLRKLYPQLKDEDIGYSRDIYFKDHVRNATKGEGCEVIISNLKGNLKNSYLGCMSYRGKYIDIMQDVDSEDYVFGMNLLGMEGNYMRVDFTSLFTNQIHEDMKVIQWLVADGIFKGHVRPLSRVTYEPQDVSRAFHFLAASRHRGRVLLNMQGKPTSVKQRISCDPNQYHVLFSFNDSLGVQLVQRLIERGAKKICIHIPNPTMYQQLKIESWRKLGVEVMLLSNDLTESKDITTMLNNVTKMGTVEGIYIVTNKINEGQTKKDIKTLLKNIDLSSRSLCPQLRYFAVVSTDGDHAQDMTLSRAASGYPATSLDLSSLNQGQTSEAYSFNNLAVEATEQAICSQAHVLQAQKEFKKAPSLMQQIATIADIKIGVNTNADLTLRELNVSDEKIAAVDAYLNSTYNLALFEEDVPLLTINKINELEESLTEIVRSNVKGLATFYTKGSFDDMFDTAQALALPTLFKDSTLLPGDIDEQKRYLGILPGLENHHMRFHILCKHLKLPAAVLQSDIDNPDDTFPQLGQKYADLLSIKNMTHQNFYLLGYETGALIALEMAAALENKGFNGTIFLVGFDPEEFQKEFEEQLSDLKTDKQLEDESVRHIYNIMTDRESPAALDAALDNATTWTEKVDAYVKYLLGHTKHSAQYTRNFLETAKSRIQQVRSYKAVQRPLRSQLVLIRAATSRAAPDFAKTLQPHSSRPIAVHQLSAPLAHATLDIQTSAIVNKYLDDETRQLFNNHSQCITYTVNEHLSYSTSI